MRLVMDGPTCLVAHNVDPTYENNVLLFFTHTNVHIYLFISIFWVSSSLCEKNDIIIFE